MSRPAPRSDLRPLEVLVLDTLYRCPDEQDLASGFLGSPTPVLCEALANPAGLGYLTAEGIEVSLNTVIDRAMKPGHHQPSKRRKAHDREVLTASTGALIQHNGSHHLWSPYT